MEAHSWRESLEAARSKCCMRETGRGGLDLASIQGGFYAPPPTAALLNEALGRPVAMLPDRNRPPLSACHGHNFPSNRLSHTSPPVDARRVAHDGRLAAIAARSALSKSLPFLDQRRFPVHARPILAPHIPHCTPNPVDGGFDLRFKDANQLFVGID